MKRVYKNWLVRITIGFAALTSARLISTFLHMTTLERIYKPRDFRRTSHLEIDQKIIDSLPKYCHTVLGRTVDPINLIVVGRESEVKEAFKKAGWHSAHPSTPLHLLLGFLSATFNKSYKSGPFTPFFINIGLQDLSYQKLTKLNSFRQRHHVRLWRTRHELTAGKRIWVAAASFDTNIRLGLMPPFIHHRIDPDLDRERDFLVQDLLDAGALMGDSHQLNLPVSVADRRRNAFGATYHTDGRARVVEIQPR
jgi:hypothetical protein